MDATPSSSTGRYARAGAWITGGTIATLLIVEVIADVVVLPADIVLIPAEAVVDLVVFGVYLWSTFGPKGKPSGRQLQRRSRSLDVATTAALAALLLLQGSYLLGSPGASAAADLSGGAAAGPRVQPAAAVPAVPHPDQASGNATWARICTGASPYNCVPQPSARRGPAEAWDGADGYTLLVGGSTTVSGGLLNDSWKFKHGAFTQIASGPTTFVARSNASLVYDALDGYMLMFGGYTGAGSYSAQTWKFLAGTWTLLSPASPPQQSAPACMVYVPLVTAHGGYVLLFGGKGKPGAGASAYYGYTWEFSAGAWTNVTASVGTSPSARGYSQCAYDAVDGYVLLFGGENTSAAPLSDTWEFNPQSSASGAWSHLAPTTSPEGRFEGNMVYVTATAATYVACGAYGTLTAPTVPGGGCSTWQWSSTGPAWTNISAAAGFGTNGIGQPKSGYDAGITDQPTYSYALRFGGYTGQVANSSFGLGNILRLTLGASNGEGYVGGSLTFYANASGGAGPVTLAWSGLPTGCTAANVSLLSCTPSAAGTFAAVTVVATGTDAFNISAGPDSILIDPLSAQTGTLSLGPLAGYHPGGFFAVKSTGTMTNAGPNSAAAQLYNQSGFSYIRYGQAGDTTNITAGCTYSDAGVCGAVQVNYSAFKVWCGWVHCRAILAVPAEANDPGLVALTVKYVEQTVGMVPCSATVPTGCIADWSVGNEPTAWTHFNIAMPSWHATDAKTPNATQFNLVIKNDTKAIRSVDATTPIIGDQEAATGGSKPIFAASAFGTFAATNGANISSLVFHSYSAVGEGSLKVPSSALSWANDVAAAGRYAQYVANVTASCPTCKVSVGVGEYNTGGSGNPFPLSYASAVGVAANAAQMLALNASLFTYDDWYSTDGLELINSTTNSVYPAYTAYEDVLRYLPTNVAYNASVVTPMHGVFAVEGVNGTTSGVLVVNANTSVTLNLAVGQVFGSDLEAVYQDGRGGPGESPTFAAALGAISIPPEGIAVLLYEPAPKVPPVPPASSSGTGAPILSSTAVAYLTIAAVTVTVVLLLAVLLVLVLTGPRRHSGRKVGH